MSSVVDKFLRYVKIDTQSWSPSDTFPSTEKQKDLGRLLAKELQEMGASDVRFDGQFGYVYATVPSTLKEGKTAPVLGFIAHMDTSMAISGKNVKPRIVENYPGGDIVLNEALSIVLKADENPELAGCVGKSLIVTDGTTLLGADDKAGVAEIMAMAEYLLAHPEIEHGTVRIGFTPDEEVGGGVDHFDVEGFGADYAYTVDGGALGELEYENFNASDVVLHVNGCSVHPGSAKGKMRNAILLAQEFQSLLPAHEAPEATEGYEGFYHPGTIQGNVEHVDVDYIIRDHDREKFEEKKAFFPESGRIPECKIRRRHHYGGHEGQLLQHEGKDPSGKCPPDRQRGEGHGNGGGLPSDHPHPRRHGRSKTVLHGTSLPEPVHGRAELPWEI